MGVSWLVDPDYDTHVVDVDDQDPASQGRLDMAGRYRPSSGHRSTPYAVTFFLTTGTRSSTSADRA